jgi:hypothetical protein
MNKSQKTWLIGGIVGAVVLICCCAAGIAGSVWWFNPGPERVTNQYFNALQDKDADKVRDLTCAARRGSLDLPDSNEELVSWEVTSTNESGDTATVLAHAVVSNDGEPQSGNVTITLVKEDGDWLVCGIRGQPD